MAIGNAGIAAQFDKKASTFTVKTFLRRYFYLCMSLALAGLVAWGFSRTVDSHLFHGNPPRPWLLWVHGAAFCSWLVFLILQSSLVTVRKVSVHRLIGWFGAGLAAVMVPLGVTIAIVMTRFDTSVLHQTDIASFLAIPFEDMLVFGTLVALAIYWRKKPEYHKRLLFMATCVLMDAAIGRFDFWFDHNIFYVGLDLLIVLGMVRDWIVDGRVHKVYLYTLPPMIAVQGLAVYLWRVNPGWWQGTTRGILG